MKFPREHEQLEKSASIRNFLVGMFMFGGNDLETGCKYSISFAAAFCMANDLEE